MKVVVSGGLGFIGSRLAESYAHDNADVVVLDSLHPQIHRDRSSVERVERFARVVLGDVRDPRAWDAVLGGADVVLHMAAETGTGQSMDEVSRYCDVNVSGTAQLIDALARHPVPKVFLPSSRAVYGEGAYRCIAHGLVNGRPRLHDEMKRGVFNVGCSVCGRTAQAVPTPEALEARPASVYATTKLTQELLLAQIGAARGIDVRIARYQNVYGPGQALGNPYTGVLVIFAQQIDAGREINVFEDGKIARDFVYIDDVVLATRAIIGKAENPGIVNVGSGSAATLIDVVRAFAAIRGHDVPFRISGDFRDGDIRHAVADISKMCSLGVVPRRPLQDGIAAVFTYSRNATNA